MVALTDYKALTDFYKGKKIFITGNTGFKGSWLSMLLYELGAEVFGYALDPPTNPSLFDLAQLHEITNTTIGDVRNYERLYSSILKIKPEIVIHMAAQPLVKESYANPRETYEINVMGTVNLLEAVRNVGSVKSFVNVTTDKCYENKEWQWGYRENDRLGGSDPYSNSKACSELVSSAYRSSFFGSGEHLASTAIATARAGNVIGGGDWAPDRLIPDMMRSIEIASKVQIRNPASIRPWQHVLEPLNGYLLLAMKLFQEGDKYIGSWNFGPEDNDAKTVAWIIDRICDKWGAGASYDIDKSLHPHEAKYLKLDCSNAKNVLGWNPKWNLETAIDLIIQFYHSYMDKVDLREVCLGQIQQYFDGENSF